ncbi:CPBP family intramembrane glutamic endopeptidase [Aquimarina mytili]|uniref:CPBP family intramembrane metalloprotease n=1 Tax=Aquimarina mytili TaxID=874423 RepID=A0A937DCD7_9FLAO|nr:type II CAAX endopeptidase family protein [Aquimarina mytili]MBL0685513.1 CPBP family intramembrane metalloprotease [Aquimarina mytili]
MYIAQGRQGKLGMWKYLPIPILFMGVMGLNYLVLLLMNADVTAIIEQQIRSKGKNQFFAESMIIFVFLLAGLFFWVKYVHKQSILSLTTSRNKIDWGRFFFTFFLMASFIIISTLIVYFTSPGDYQINFKPVPFLILAIIAIVLIPIQTSFEEYMFRGYLMQGLGLAVKNKWFPLILTSVLFGVMHASNPEVEKIGPILMIYYIGTGLFLGVMTLMDEGLELSLGFHAANNLVTVLLVTADWTALQTDSIFIDVSDPGTGSYEIFIPILIIFPLFLFILSKKYKWTGWKDKLFGHIPAS